jgi:hypothetical protein
LSESSSKDFETNHVCFSNITVQRSYQQQVIDGTEIIVVTLRKRCLCHVGSILCTLLLPFQVAAIGGIPAGHVASHGLERDIVNADGTGEGAGYFTFIEGISGPFFANPLPPSEATAFFTFITAPFSTVRIPNGNVVALLHPPGNFYVYLNPTPIGNWNDFTTFAHGQLIATLEFGTTQDINTGSVQMGLHPRG